MEEIKCAFGCGKVGSFQLKNGKMCCSKFPNSCSSVRIKNSEGSKNRIYHNGTNGLKGRDSWNFGKKTPESIRKKISESKKGKKNPYILSDEAKKKKSIRMSEIAKERGIGGYKKGSGRGKHGWYKGYWCDSSWELAWVIYNLDHGVKFERNKDRFNYNWETQKHYYLPDFKLLDGTYVEIKGWMTGQTKAKLLSCPFVLVLLEKDMIPILTYVKGKYGKNFIEQYEDKKK